MTEIKISDELNGKNFLEMAFERCIKCSTCKYSYNDFLPSCPSGEKFLFESYWASGRIRLIRGLIKGELDWSDDLKHAIFACPTCGACSDSCQAPHSDYIMDMIEALRELAVKKIGPGPNQEKLVQRTLENFNPYGEPNSNNEDLKKKYNLPDKAEWVYFIGCTSNYRQQKIRDATIQFLIDAGINFTLIDEHCCTSPLLRTGQVDNVKDFMNYNIKKVKDAGSSKVITSCAGCYRTMKKDFEKYGIESDVNIYHTIELIKNLLDEKQIRFKGKFNKIVTYHDPCHLGRHMGIYEIPREIYRKIPGLELVEMERNRNHAWCCGAGGGVKIGFPEWSIEISNERLIEAKATGASILSSVCPFCRTNLSDANEKYAMRFDVLDLLEIVDQVGIEKVNRGK